MNLRELHDMRVVSAPCKILPPSGLRYHITAVPEAKFIQHRVIAPFPPEDIVTLFQQLLLFKKSFTHFFRSLPNGLFPDPAAAVDARRSPFAFEVLDGTLVLFRLLPRIEGPEISSLPGLGILLSGVKSVLPRFQLSNHSRPPVAAEF